MSTMRVLPPSIREIVVPRFFSPSSFSVFGQCILRGIAHAKHSCLPPSPRVILGLVLHHLRKEALDGRCSCMVRDRDPESGCFREMMLQVDRQLSERRDTSSLIPIMEVLRWRDVSVGLARLRRWLEPVENRLGCERIRPLADMFASQVHGERYSDRLLQIGAEAWIVSPRWRLRGRVDSIREVGGRRLEITDFKSGRLLERDGALRRDVEGQVRLYALAAHESTDLPIRLFVEGDARHEVSWNDSDRDATAIEVSEVLSMLPTGRQLSAVRLANPGPWCSGCRIRPRCEGYLSSAPAMWQDQSLAGRLPFDTWGEIIAIRRSKSVWNIEIEDANGDLVVVQGLQSTGSGDSVQVGDHIYLFGLETSEQRISHGVRVRPRNFHVIPPDGGFRLRKAHTAVVFFRAMNVGTHNGVDVG